MLPHGVDARSFSLYFEFCLTRLVEVVAIWKRSRRAIAGDIDRDLDSDSVKALTRAGGFGAPRGSRRLTRLNGLF